MVKVLGIDQSLNHTGYVVLIDGKVLKTGLIEPKIKGTIRLVTIRNELIKLLEFHRPHLVGMEDYAYSGRGRVFNLGELGGIIKVLCADKRKPLMIINPLQIKKYATNNGKADKELMIKKTKEKTGILFSDDNICDAYNIANIVTQVFNVQAKITKLSDYKNYEKEIIKEYLIKKNGKNIKE